ncbi:MAG: inositol monophosphatase [Candidatus Thermoplasmatota archaeon]|nr:inositol monophosphatase [Candidatus Thermoplasmatota archaeon]
MDEEIKHLAITVVNKVFRGIRKAGKDNFAKWNTNVGIGADGTPTKYIDKLAEDIALTYLSKPSTPVNILSEEVGFIDNDADYTFVLDPVDGTRNACRGIPFYTVSLAIGKKSLDDIEYGIVKNIPTGDLFLAEKGRGTYYNNNRIAIPEVPASELLSSLSLGKNFDEITLSLAQREKVRSLGSASLEMCMVASGALDVYVVGNAYLRVTDIAASTLIVREAGGIVADSNGKRLNMPLTLDERTGVIAAGNRELIKWARS